MIAVVVVVICLGAVAFAFYRKAMAGGPPLLDRFKNVPSSTIAQLPPGQEARMIGEAQLLDGHMRAPLSGRPCLAWSVHVEQLRPNGRGRSDWYPLIRDTRVVSFGLADGTGRAIVDAVGATLVLDYDTRSTSGILDDPTEAERAFLARYKVSGKGLVFNKDLRYREAVIEIGERIAVLGTVSRDPSSQALRIVRSEKQPLLISDDAAVTTSPAS